jgi:polyisoprenoid-binding protein YceI
MRRLLMLAIMLPLVVSASPRAGVADRALAVTVSPSCCSIGFTAYAFGIFPIEGRFGTFEGRLVYDPAAPAAGHAEARIHTASLTLDGGPIEADVKAPHFLDVAQYPLILFRAAEPALPDGATLHGMLTIKGVTHPVALTLRQGGDAVTAEALISRSQFGITARPVLAGDTIAIRITAPLPR